MSKDDKTKPNVEVKRANASAIKRKISANCQDDKLTIEFEMTDAVTKNPSTESDYLGNPIWKSAWTYNEKRSNFIYRVIRERKYYKKEGSNLGVTEDHIFDTFTRLNYSLTEIEVFEHRNEFDKYLYECFQAELEAKAHEEWQCRNGSLLNQLMMHNSTPSLIFKSLYEVETKIKTVDAAMRSLLNDLKFNRVSGSEFDELRPPLDVSLIKLRERQDYLTAMYKRLVESSKYHRRKYLTKLFSDSYRELSVIPTLQPKANCKTISVCMFYIEQYCGWYNRTFCDQILESRKENDKIKRQLKRKENLKPDIRLEVLKPFLDTGLSYQKIANVTGIPKTTVIQLMKKLV